MKSSYYKIRIKSLGFTNTFLFLLSYKEETLSLFLSIFFLYQIRKEKNKKLQSCNPFVIILHTVQKDRPINTRKSQIKYKPSREGMLQKNFAYFLYVM